MPSPRRTAKAGAAKRAPARKRAPKYQPQLDHDGDGVNGGSLPREARETAPAPAPEAVAPAEDETIRVGTVEARLRLEPIGFVQSLLSDKIRDRVERQRALPSAPGLDERVRVSEGRCAPIAFVDGEPPTLFDGVDTLAAAISLGLERVAVLYLPPGNVGEVQSALVRMRQPPPNPQDPDEEMIWKVNAFHDRT